MEQWILKSADIAYVLDNENIEPQLGSPFVRLERPDKGLKPPSAQDWPSLVEALATIANPDLVLGLINYPPEDPQFSWFYGNSSNDRLALHKQKFDGTEHRIVWPLHPQDVFDDFLSPLQPAMPASCENTALCLDKDTLATVAAIVDIMQEDSLIAFLNRSVPPESSFHASDLLACFYRSLQGADFRWMAWRVKLISPVNLAPSVEDIERGLAGLERKKLTPGIDGRYGLSTELAVLAARLSECSGFSALSIREKLARPTHNREWDHQHIAAARGLDSLWLYEFSDIREDNFTLELKDTSPTILQQRLESIRLSEEQRVPHSQPLAESHPPPSSDMNQKPRVKSRKTKEMSHKFCSQCGAKLRPGASFCSGCGYQLSSKGTRQ